MTFQKPPTKSKRLIADWPEHLSYDTSDKQISDYYSNVSGAITRSESFFYKKQLTDIFLYAMSIGKKLEERKPLKQRSNSIPKTAFQEDEVWIMISTVMSVPNSDLHMLEDQNAKEIAHTCEEYANAGIYQLIALDMHTGGDKLRPFEQEFEKLIDTLD